MKIASEKYVILALTISALALPFWILPEMTRQFLVIYAISALVGYPIYVYRKKIFGIHIFRTFYYISGALIVSGGMEILFGFRGAFSRLVEPGTSGFIPFKSGVGLLVVCIVSHIYATRKNDRTSASSQ